MRIAVSIILPTYNEVDNIIPLIQELEKVVKQKKEIIVVDDNSPDGTSDKVKQYAKNHSDVKIETRYHNRGLTNSIQHGITMAKGDIVVWMDCDFSHPPAVVPMLLKKIDEGCDVAVASRFVPGGKAKSEGPRDSLLGIILSKILNILMQFLLQNKFFDYTSGFVAVRREVFKNIKLRGDYGEYFMDFIVQVFRNGFRVVEIPFVSQPRRAGESKTGKNLVDYILRGRKYLYVALRLVYENIIYSLKRH